MMILRPLRQAGTSLIEVLVTVVILGFGLIGIAVFQTKAQVASVESYQRAQAVIMLEDMRARMVSNPDNAALYASTSAVLGTGVANPPTSCTGETAGVNRDLCEWGLALRGASETRQSTAASVTTTSNFGAMTGARGCIRQLQAPDNTANVCRPGTYLITVAWQGLHATRAPSLTCGQDAFTGETYRRAISVRVATGLRTCRV
ncbi:MAG: type IV pilus modification protein PilV [Pseudomonadota bacterium]